MCLQNCTKRLETGKKVEEKFGGDGKNAYLCSVKPQVWLIRYFPSGARQDRHYSVLKGCLGNSLFVV